MSLEIDKRWIGAVCGLALGGVIALGPMAAAAAEPVLKLVFVEREAGIAPYQTRMLVTPAFLRVDDGEGSANYILFDRAKRTIHTVTAETRSIMSIGPRPMDAKPPFELELTEQRLGAMADAPAIEGKTPQHYRFEANGQECYHVVAVDGLMPDAVRALREFREVLAGDSAVTFSSVPADMHDACDMAANTFAPNRHLAFGFPIQEWDTEGYARYLLDYDGRFDPSAEGELFELPGDYVRYTVQELREGRAPAGAGH